MAVISIEEQLRLATRKLEDLQHWQKIIKKYEHIKSKRVLKPKEEAQYKICQQHFIDEANEGIR